MRILMCILKLPEMERISDYIYLQTNWKEYTILCNIKTWETLFFNIGNLWKYCSFLDVVPDNMIKTATYSMVWDLQHQIWRFSPIEKNFPIKDIIRNVIKMDISFNVINWRIFFNFEGRNLIYYHMLSWGLLYQVNFLRGIILSWILEVEKSLFLRDLWYRV